MELHLSTTIELPYAAAAAALAEGPPAWLPLVLPAPRPGAAGEPDRGSGCVLVSTGAAQPFAGSLLVPIECQAAEHPERYPTLAGALRLEPAGSAGCRLRLDAHCEPAGRGGHRADRAALGRLAEAYAGQLVEGVAARLARRCPPGERTASARAGVRPPPGRAASGTGRPAG